MNQVGNRYNYWTWDTTPRNGLYFVGHGTRYGWTIIKGFKTLGGAKRYAIRMAGTDTYIE